MFEWVIAPLIKSMCLKIFYIAKWTRMSIIDTLNKPTTYWKMKKKQKSNKLSACLGGLFIVEIYLILYMVCNKVY